MGSCYKSHSQVSELERDAWEPDQTPTFPLEVSTKLQDFPDHTLRDDRLGEGSSYHVHLDLPWALHTLPKQTIEKHLHKKDVLHTRMYAPPHPPQHTHLKKRFLELGSWLGVGGGDLHLWTLLAHHKHISNLTYKYLVNQHSSFN